MAVFRPLHPFRPQAHIVAGTVFQDLPRPIARKRFRGGVSRPLYTLLGQQKRRGYQDNAVFYVFPNSASPEPETPSGYVVVGGADYVTYASIQFTRNVLTSYATDASGNIHGYYSTRGGTELMLAEEEDLEDAP